MDSVGCGSQEPTTRFPPKPATKAVKKLIEKMSAAPAQPKANRGHFKQKRAKLVQTAANIAARQALVKTAWKEIEYAKCRESFAVVPGKRRRGKPCVKDVCVWLVAHRYGKFGFCTIADDVRVLKSQGL